LVIILFKNSYQKAEVGDIFLIKKDIKE